MPATNFRSFNTAVPHARYDELAPMPGSMSRLLPDMILHVFIKRRARNPQRFGDRLKVAISAGRQVYTFPEHLMGRKLVQIMQ